MTSAVITCPRPRRLYGDELAAGAIVGSYRVEALAGRGGFASVYRARHLTLARSVALKVLHKDFAGTQDMLQRFLGEARAVNRIAHPNIVDIHDVGSLRDGRPFLVMEWLDGRSLASELAVRGPLTPLETLAIMEDLLPALAAAHRAGVVHRDLTASNVIAIPRGDWFVVKLVDFGIAKLLCDDPRPGSTPSDVRLGTPSHMSPEQIRGDTIDARTDIYGAGVLLYQLLSGRLPFVATTAVELTDLHLEAIAPRLSSCVAVALAIDDVVARCLAKCPSERWPDMPALLAALRAAILEQDVASPTAELAIGVHVEIYLDDPDRVDASAFDAIDALLADGTAVFVGFAVTAGAMELTATGALAHADRALAAASAMLSVRRGDGLALAVTVHVGTLAALAHTGSWKATAPSHAVQHTPAARLLLELA